MIRLYQSVNVYCIGLWVYHHSAVTPSVMGLSASTRISRLAICLGKQSDSLLPYAWGFGSIADKSVSKVLQREWTGKTVFGVSVDLHKTLIWFRAQKQTQPIRGTRKATSCPTGQQARLPIEQIGTTSRSRLKIKCFEEYSSVHSRGASLAKSNLLTQKTQIVYYLLHLINKQMIFIGGIFYMD